MEQSIAHAVKTIGQRVQCTPVEARERFAHAVHDLLYPHKATRDDSPLTGSLLRHMYDYNDGALRHRTDGFRFRAGDPAASFGTSSNRRIKMLVIDGRGYPHARCVWLWHHNEWPDRLHHKNFDRLDDRIENLESLTQSEICRKQVERKMAQRKPSETPSAQPSGPSSEPLSREIIGAIMDNGLPDGKRWMVFTVVGNDQNYHGSYYTEAEAMHVYRLNITER